LVHWLRNQYLPVIADLAKELGLFYANSLPAALAAALIPLVGLGWAALKVKEHEKEFEGLQVFIWSILLVVTVIAALQVPAAYGSAKSYCREEWEKAGGTDLSYEAPLLYRASKCDSIWPLGPDR
jgi:hypothetical protein